MERVLALQFVIGKLARVGFTVTCDSGSVQNVLVAGQLADMPYCKLGQFLFRCCTLLFLCGRNLFVYTVVQSLPFQLRQQHDAHDVETQESLRLSSGCVEGRF